MNNAPDWVFTLLAYTALMAFVFLYLNAFCDLIRIVVRLFKGHHDE